MVSFPCRLVASTVLLASGLSALPAMAASKQQALVDRATLAVQDIFQGTNPNSRAQRYLAKARAVMVCPSVFRMSIVFGGAGGGCLLLSRDARGSWSDPAFYTLSSASMGIQLGVESSELMFFVMSDRGLQALLDSQFKFSAGASASFANMGSGIESGSAGASNTDILALQKSSGLFAGASLGGSKLTIDSSSNRAFYNQPVGPEDIVISMRVNNTGADPLRRVLMQVVQQQGSTPATGSAAATSPATTSSAGSSPYPANYDSRKSYASQSHGAIKSESLAAPK
ncbi:lipid-binding SYLF domain-containing protein [Asaia sp. As-1742]|uniref:lipid-binding SYLF domain-containing protein n=1 Tax=Asaia sp. As-1742 TaxID=2608325 RepID=UPI00141E16C1|nr:lipid-binding SYLF domain-containing protein [Asaia sp. As-1742]NIE81242.1 lipid-binding SYLF domain-containing protein [Asaia sp. As-1742]